MENELLIKGYTNRKCKTCLGKGYVEYFYENNNANKYLCNCVVQKAKKDFNDE